MRAALSSARATCEDSASRPSAAAFGQLLVAADDEQGAQLVLHEQRDGEHRAGGPGEVEPAYEAGHGALDRSMASKRGAVELGLGELDRRADEVPAPGRGRDHGERLGLVGVQMHEQAGISLGRERAGRLHGGRVDPVAVRRRHEGGARGPQGLLATEGQLQLVDQAGHPRHDEDEQRDGRDRDHPQVGVLLAKQLDRPHRLRDEGPGADEDQPAARHADLLVGRALGEVALRLVQRGRAPEEVEDAPPGLQIAGLVVHQALDGDVAVDEVGDEQRERGRREQVEGQAAATGPDDQADDDREQDEVHERVAHAHELLREGRGGVLGRGGHEEDPRDDADADGDDERVDHALAVPAGVPAPDEHEDPGDQARVDGQVQDVADRGERELGPEQLVVVVGDHVARRRRTPVRARTGTTAPGPRASRP